MIAHQHVKRISNEMNPTNTPKLTSTLGSVLTSLRVLSILVVALVSLLMAGCDEPSDYSTSMSPESELRIISLSPALTKILVDLGQGDYIVGVGQNDDAAPKNAKVVGTYLNINAEQIVSLNPTIVLTMSGRDGPPARLKELAKTHFLLVDYPYPQTPTDVGNIIFRDSEMHMAMAMSPIASAQAAAPGAAGAPGTNDPSSPAVTPTVETGPSSIGALLDLIPQAMNLKYTMIMRLGEISKLTTDKNDGQSSPSVLMVIGTGPVMAAGPGTVLDQLLALAGGKNAAAQTQTTAPTFDREKLVALKPDVVLYFDPKGQPLAALDDEPRLADFRDLKIPAVTNNRLKLIDHPLSMLPSSSLEETAGMMAKAIYPEMSEQIDKILASSMADLSRQNDIDAMSKDAGATPAMTAGSVTNPAKTPAQTTPADQPADVPADAQPAVEN